MIANPGIKAYRYDPYTGRLLLEEYDHHGMKHSRKIAILRAREGKNWGIVLGTLGRQGNPRILDRLQGKMKERGFSWTIFLMSEISPARVSLFGDSVDAWIQIACPRLSIDWGESFGKPLLNPFEAEIALGLIPGWWEKASMANSDCNKNGVYCNHNCDNGVCAIDNDDVSGDYPMDYYAQDGGEWNSSYAKNLNRNRPSRRSV